jgi:predicted DNA binding CopG/RHH family protein
MHRKEVQAYENPIPTFNTDQEAEDFVARSDPTEFDLSGGQIVRFELRPKDKAINLRLPESLLNTVGQQAEKAGMPYQRYIRIALEQGGGSVKR